MVLWLAAAGAASAATPIYRCGQSYSQTPCPGGHVVDSTDSRTAEQRAEARRMAARERRLAEMEHERLASEAALKPAAAIGIHSRTTPASSNETVTKKAKARKGKKATAGEDFVATDPALAKPRKRP
jgi:hypothetical protein